MENVTLTWGHEARPPLRRWFLNQSRWVKKSFSACHTPIFTVPLATKQAL